MTAGGGGVAQFRASGHILGGMTGGYLTLDIQGYWRSRQNNGTAPSWSDAPLDRVGDFLGVQRDGRVYLGRLQTVRGHLDPSWEKALPALSCRVIQDVEGMAFHVTEPSPFRGAELRVASTILPFDYDLSARPVIIFRCVLRPDPEQPCEAWTFGFLITPALLGQQPENLAWQQIRLRIAEKPGQSRPGLSAEPSQENGLVFFWTEGPERAVRGWEGVAFVPEWDEHAVIPMIRYWPGDPATFFERLAGAASLRDVPQWPEDVKPDSESGPCWMLMGKVQGESEIVQPVTLILAWREIQTGTTEFQKKECPESLELLRPVLAPGTREYLTRECGRLHAFHAGVRPEYIRSNLARSLMEIPSRAGLTTDELLYPPAGRRTFLFQELLQWHLLFPRWARNTLLADLRKVSAEPDYAAALALIFRVVLDCFFGPGPHIPQFFSSIRKWRIWQRLVIGSGPADLEQATALRALASVAACAGWESVAVELRLRAQYTARSWQQTMDAALRANQGVSLNQAIASAIHYMALSLLFWYDDLLDWKVAEALLSRVSHRPQIHPEWLVRLGVISLAWHGDTLAVWQAELRKLFDQFSQQRAEPSPGFASWAWPLAVVGGRCWPDLGTRQLNLAIPHPADRQGIQRWQAMTPVGICDLQWMGNAQGGRLAARLPAPVDLGSILVRMPGDVIPGNPALIIDGECVPPEGITMQHVERRWQLTFARRMRIGGELMLTL